MIFPVEKNPCSFTVWLLVIFLDFVKFLPSNCFENGSFVHRFVLDGAPLSSTMIRINITSDRLDLFMFCPFSFEQNYKHINERLKSLTYFFHSSNIVEIGYEIASSTMENARIIEKCKEPFVSSSNTWLFLDFLNNNFFSNIGHWNDWQYYFPHVLTLPMWSLLIFGDLQCLVNCSLHEQSGVSFQGEAFFEMKFSENYITFQDMLATIVAVCIFLSGDNLFLSSRIFIFHKSILFYVFQSFVYAFLILFEYSMKLKSLVSVVFFVFAWFNINTHNITVLLLSCCYFYFPFILFESFFLLIAVSWKYLETNTIIVESLTNFHAKCLAFCIFSFYNGTYNATFFVFMYYCFVYFRDHYKETKLLSVSEANQKTFHITQFHLNLLREKLCYDPAFFHYWFRKIRHRSELLAFISGKSDKSVVLKSCSSSASNLRKNLNKKVRLSLLKMKSGLIKNRRLEMSS